MPKVNIDTLLEVSMANLGVPGHDVTKNRATVHHVEKNRTRPICVDSMRINTSAVRVPRRFSAIFAAFPVTVAELRCRPVSRAFHFFPLRRYVAIFRSIVEIESSFRMKKKVGQDMQCLAGGGRIRATDLRSRKVDGGGHDRGGIVLA